MTEQLKQGYIPMPRSKSAVPAREAVEFVPIKPMSIPMRDNLARCAEYRAKGKSWRPGE